MRGTKIIALLLAGSLLAGLTGCARKSRRPTLPAAPLQSSFPAEDAGAAQSTAPMTKSAAVGSAQQSSPEETTEALLEEFLQPLDKEDALYQDYTTEHRAQYKKLRQRPEEVITLVLPELLSDVAALERYSDDTSRATLLYCLFKDTLQNEPFCWDGDSYRWLSDMLAEFIQFVSGHMLSDGSEWFKENAPLTGLCAAVMCERPALRLNMTPCEPVYNAQALTNAKLVFAAALEGRDAETFGFDPWPKKIADGFDFTTDWTLSQDEAGAVTLTAADPDTGSTASFCYQPNEAEKRSLLSGYGSLLLTTQDGARVQLSSQNADAQYTPVGYDEPVQDDELVLENGVELGMDYNTVLRLTGAPHQVWSDTMAGMGLESRGVIYVFLYDEALVMRLQSISFRFAEDTVTNVTAELPAARKIALGDTMQSVFDKLPSGDTTLKKRAEQFIYQDASGASATLQFVADSFYSLDIITPGGRVLSITFSRLDRTVNMIDIA